MGIKNERRASPSISLARDDEGKSRPGVYGVGMWP